MIKTIDHGAQRPHLDNQEIRSMTARKRAKTGDYVQIPLDDGTFGYAKVLGTEVAFLGLRTSSPEITLDVLTSRPRCFVFG